MIPVMMVLVSMGATSCLRLAFFESAPTTDSNLIKEVQTAHFIVAEESGSAEYLEQAMEDGYSDFVEDSLKTLFSNEDAEFEMLDIVKTDANDGFLRYTVTYRYVLQQSDHDFGGQAGPDHDVAQGDTVQNHGAPSDAVQNGGANDGAQGLHDVASIPDHVAPVSDDVDSVSGDVTPPPLNADFPPPVSGDGNVPPPVSGDDATDAGNDATNDATDAVHEDHGAQSDAVQNDGAQRQTDVASVSDEFEPNSDDVKPVFDDAAPVGGDVTPPDLPPPDFGGDVPPPISGDGATNAGNGATRAVGDATNDLAVNPQDSVDVDAHDSGVVAHASVAPTHDHDVDQNDPIPQQS